MKDDVSNLLAPARVEPSKPGVAISSKWRPTHGGSHDIDSGVYWERYPRPDNAEKRLQRALLETANDTTINARCAKIQALRGENHPSNYEEQP